MILLNPLWFTICLGASLVSITRPLSIMQILAATSFDGEELLNSSGNLFKRGPMILIAVEKTVYDFSLKLFFKLINMCLGTPGKMLN